MFDLEQVLALLCKWPDSKYFSLDGPVQSLLQLLSHAGAAQKQYS